MEEDCDDYTLEDEWPNDDEANDIMLAYAATEETSDPRSGCAGGVRVLCITILAFAWLAVL